jgi:hypothetical protein
MNEMGGTSSNVWGRGEVYAGFWWGNLKGRDHLGDLGIDWRIILKCNYKNWDEERTGLISPG